MSMLPENPLAFRQWLTDRLRPEVPLDHKPEADANTPVVIDQDNPYYVPVHEPLSEGDGALSAVDKIRINISNARHGSLNFLSGFAGTGKTSELNRLKALLSGAGYYVAFAKAKSHFSLTSPVVPDIFLIRLAAAYWATLAADHDIEIEEETFWDKAGAWLEQIKVKLTKFEFKLMGFKLKYEIVHNADFIEQLRQALESQREQLVEFVRQAFAEATAAMNAKYGSAYRPVFILDEFEKLQDTYNTNGSVAESIASIMRINAADLNIPDHHLILTMPPWLPWVVKGVPNVRNLFAVPLWENTPERNSHSPGMKLMRKVVEKRFTVEGLDRFFGPPNKNGLRHLLDRVIHASGGHLRDLISLLAELLLYAQTSDSNPEGPLVTRTMVDLAIRDRRQAYMPISVQEARWLREVAQTRKCEPDANDATTVRLLTGLLDSHSALILPNGDPWFDVHPILRDVVNDIVRRHPLTPPPAPAA